MPLAGAGLSCWFYWLYINREDFDWGIYVNCAGKQIIEPGVPYPPQDHNPSYYFNSAMDMGRVLNEYQIHYITEGEGIYGAFRSWKFFSGCPDKKVG